MRDVCLMRLRAGLGITQWRGEVCSCVFEKLFGELGVLFLLDGLDEWDWE